jgi:hypothetical protein
VQVAQQRAHLLPADVLGGLEPPRAEKLVGADLARLPPVGAVGDQAMLE